MGVPALTGNFITGANVTFGGSGYTVTPAVTVNAPAGLGRALITATVSRLVTPPRPVLAMVRIPPASVRLVWPTNDPPFSLQSSTNLNPASWAPASPPPVALGTNNVVTNSTAGGERFFRLINP